MDLALFRSNPGVNRNQIVLGTTKGDLWVDDGMKLVTGSGYASISSVDSGKVNRIGVGAEVQDVWSGGDVTLANYATVNGALVGKACMAARFAQTRCVWRFFGLRA